MSGVPGRTLLIVLLLLICGCSGIIRSPKVTLQKTNLIGLDTTGADMECWLTVSNPNPFDVSLLGYTYDLRVLTLPLSGGGRQAPLAIPAGSETDMLLPVRVQYSDLLEILKRRPDPDRIPYHLSARLHLDTPLGEMLVPVEQSESFAIPEAYRPGLHLDRLRSLFRLSP